MEMCSSLVMSEQEVRIVVEIYAPVFDGRDVVGVMELYETDEALSSPMVRSEEVVWQLVVGVGGLLYLLLLAVLFLSHWRRDESRKI